MAIEKIQAIRGMSDMLPEDAPLWHFFEKKLLLWQNSTVISIFVPRSSNRPVCSNAESVK